MANVRVEGWHRIPPVKLELPPLPSESAQLAFGKMRKAWRDLLTGGATVSATATTTYTFLGLNVSTIVASGSAAAIGVASALVVGAGAASYGVGTLIDRTFNLSDRIGDGLYNFFH